MRTTMPYRLTQLMLTLALGVIALIGCESAPSTSDKDLVHVDYAQLKEWLAENNPKKPVLLVDIRKPDLYQAGHIEGAINIPQAELKSADSRLRGADRIIFYHESFSGLYADMAAKKLIAEGVGNVYSYGGGYVDWKKRSEGQ